MDSKQTSQIRQITNQITKTFEEFSKQKKPLSMIDFGTLTTLEMIAHTLELPIQKDMKAMIDRELQLI